MLLFVRWLMLYIPVGMPSFEQQRFCSLEEYYQYREQRLPPKELFEGQDYAFMGKLKPNSDNEDAFMSPVRCLSIPELAQRRGLWIVRLAVLDDDMRPRSEYSQIIPIKQCGLIERTTELIENDPLIQEAYIKSYADETDNGLPALQTEIDKLLTTV